MAKSKSLAKAVNAEVKDAETDVKSGNVTTQDTAKAPKAPVDLPTNARSHPPE